PEIHAYKLRVLEDDRHFFTTYEALLIYRADLAARAPAAVAAFERLEGRLDNPTMIGLNERTKMAGVAESEVAIDFVAANVSDKAIGAPRQHPLSSIAARAGEHSALVLLSLLAASALAVPLGIIAARLRRLGRYVVGAAGLLQTIPSLALLVLLIPLLGIGSPPPPPPPPSRLPTATRF